MNWLTRRYSVAPRPNRRTGWVATAVIEKDGVEAYGLSTEFKTKKEARAYADFKDEELVAEGTYRRSK